MFSRQLGSRVVQHTTTRTFSHSKKNIVKTQIRLSKPTRPSHNLNTPPTRSSYRSFHSTTILRSKNDKVQLNNNNNKTLNKNNGNNNNTTSSSSSTPKTKAELDRTLLPHSTTTFGTFRHLSNNDMLLNSFALTTFTFIAWYFVKFVMGSVLTVDHWSSFDEKIRQTKNNDVLTYHTDSETLLLQGLEFKQDTDSKDEALFDEETKNRFLSNTLEQAETYLYKQERTSYHELVQTLNELKDFRHELKQLTLKLQQNRFEFAPIQQLSGENGTNIDNNDTIRQREELFERLYMIFDNDLMSLSCLHTNIMEIARSISSLQQYTLYTATQQLNIRQYYPKLAQDYYVSELLPSMIDYHDDLRHYSLKLLHQQLILKKVCHEYNVIFDELLSKHNNNIVSSSKSGNTSQDKTVKVKMLDVEINQHILSSLTTDDYINFINRFDTIRKLTKENDDDNNNNVLSTNDIQFNQLLKLNTFNDATDMNNTVQHLENIFGGIETLIMGQLDHFLPRVEAYTINVPVFVNAYKNFMQAQADATGNYDKVGHTNTNITGDNDDNNTSNENHQVKEHNSSTTSTPTIPADRNIQLYDFMNNRPIMQEHYDLTNQKATAIRNRAQTIQILPNFLKGLFVGTPEEYITTTVPIIEVVTTPSFLIDNDVNDNNEANNNHELNENDKEMAMLKETFLKQFTPTLPIINKYSQPRGTFTPLSSDSMKREELYLNHIKNMEALAKINDDKV